ncbi:hypothetical protein FQN57_004176 [Myotisia sp. PD_48]|nr:hypothetical protein FQN57_004176 [Myotisia sp. PD_48]
MGAGQFGLTYLKQGSFLFFACDDGTLWDVQSAPADSPTQNLGRDRIGLPHAKNWKYTYAVETLVPPSGQSLISLNHSLWEIMSRHDESSDNDNEEVEVEGIDITIICRCSRQPMATQQSTTMTTTTDVNGFLRTSFIMQPTPQLSLKRELTPPSISDPQLLRLYDRLNQLDAKVAELCNNVLTKEAYVDRRNREDEFVRREFESQRTLSSRIDHAVCKTRADVGQVMADLSRFAAEIIQLRTALETLVSKEEFLQPDLAQLQTDFNKLQTDFQRMSSELCATNTNLSQVHSIVSQLRIDQLTLQRETNQHFTQVNSRFDIMETKLTLMERTRFNSLAHTVHAPITPVPVMDSDGTLRYPEYFPRTVWQFWCLKKSKRLHRLVELATFYNLEGYEYWGRMPGQVFPNDGYMSDSSDSSELPSNLTLAEAAREYPEACHHTLAATLGLVYSKIRKEVGETPAHSHVMAAPLRQPVHRKRFLDDVTSIHSSTKERPAKHSRQSNTDHSSHRIFTNFNNHHHNQTTMDTKSIVSEGLDRLGWNVNGANVSNETLGKLSGLVKDEMNNFLVQAFERGQIKLQSGDAKSASPTESRNDLNMATVAGEQPSSPYKEPELTTIPTQLLPFPVCTDSDADVDDTPSGSVVGEDGMC